MSELRGLQLRADEFEELGIRIAGLVVDPPERNREVVEDMGLDYAILSDPDARAIAAFGLTHEDGAPGGGVIARPALYLVENGRVRWRELTDNWRIRARPEDVLAAARATLGAPDA